ncbi:hypothetical protein AGLY_001589 [Aphis glycines]|uniref:Uncharacterized protein n=1 Tax=Aphis glycines TaxID=307491 RepID=A0A6G0U6L0_APHGL|nr:hypothetical protein AGLY_001589 [Aphis glycines]
MITIKTHLSPAVGALSSGSDSGIGSLGFKSNEPDHPIHVPLHSTTTGATAIVLKDMTKYIAYLCLRTKSPSAFLPNTNGRRLETTMRGALISLFLFPIPDKSGNPLRETPFKSNEQKQSGIALLFYPHFILSNGNLLLFFFLIIEIATKPFKDDSVLVSLFKVELNSYAHIHMSVCRYDPILRHVTSFDNLGYKTEGATERRGYEKRLKI